MPTPPISAAKRSAVVRHLKAKKLTYEKIAALVGVGNGTVSVIAAEEGLTGAAKRARLETVRARVHEAAKEGGTFEEIGKRAGVDGKTARRHAAQPLGRQPMVEDEVSGCPEPERRVYEPFLLPSPGMWLVIGDIHVPYHDRATVEAAVRLAKRDGAVGVLLNGDTLDSHEISSHDRDPSAPRYVREVEIGRDMIGWFRSQLPKAHIVFKEGNHCARLDKYVMGRAPALFDLEFVNLRSLLHFSDYGVIDVRDKRVVKAGKLHIVHGHEYPGGGGVNPARWLYLRARSMAMCSHFHRTSEHHARDISQKFEATWSLGCACHLSPAYAPLNEWNHGFAMVEVHPDGSFEVRNLRVVNGRVL